METQFLTPTEIWEGFNPVKDGTETSIISSREKDNIVTNDVFFTSEKTEDARVRVFARISYDLRWRDVRPAVLVLPSQDETRQYDDLSESLVKEGYVVCICDYAGNFEGGGDKPHTVYPEEYAYAQSPKCFAHLFTIGKSARETPWFQWVKVARRAITVLSETKYVDADRICVMGVDCGAQIAWQVAGIDGRVRALVPINGGGYLWRRNQCRFCGDALPYDDEERAFSAGVGAETYARFVSCPTCYIVSSNSISADVDRAGDILDLVPAETKSLMIIRGSSSQVTMSAYRSMLGWMSANFAHDGEPSQLPKLSFRADGNTLYLHLRCPSAPVSSEAYFSAGEPVSFARDWMPLSSAQKVGENEFVYKVPVNAPDDLITAFACVNVDGEIVLSPPVAAVVPASLGIKKGEDAAEAKSRILYSGNMGTGLFWVTTNDFFLDENVLGSVAGPFGIKGVRTTKGKLVLCRNTQEEYASDKSALLQMDVYSETPRTICFSFLSYPDRVHYRCRIALKGGDFWQKVKLSAAECKNDEGRSLSRFGICKLMTIADAENVVFNNLVWI